MQTITLFYKDGSSDKVYQASVVAAGDGYAVNFAYGRRGSTLKTGTKTKQPVDLAKAQKIYDKLVQSKRKKGYDDKPGVNGAVYSTSDATDSGVRCQLLNPVDEAEVAALIASPDWWAQQKHDGKRMLVRKEGGQSEAINRKGLIVGAPAGILSAVDSAAEDAVIVDGEAVGDTLFAFDFIDLLQSPDQPFSDRLGRLEEADFGPNVVIVETARTTAEKQALYGRLRAKGEEGIVFKRHNAPYKAGRPNSGGNQLKFKFYNTTSVQVTAHNDKRSVAIAVGNENGGEVAVGNVTIPPNYDVPPVGAVVEVRYLYAYEGGSLYQPVYLGERDDVDVDVVSQLKFKQD